MLKRWYRILKTAIMIEGEGSWLQALSFGLLGLRRANRVASQRLVTGNVILSAAVRCSPVEQPKPGQLLAYADDIGTMRRTSATKILISMTVVRKFFSSSEKNLMFSPAAWNRISLRYEHLAQTYHRGRTDQIPLDILTRRRKYQARH